MKLWHISLLSCVCIPSLVFADCPSGTTEGAQIFCIYDNGNDGDQFQVCLDNGTPTCAYGIAYPGVPGTPEPFHGCEGQYAGIAYCGVQGGSAPTATPTSTATRTPSATRAPTAVPTAAPTLAPAGCSMGSYMESVNANGKLATADTTVTQLFKKNVAAVSPLWVKTKNESAAAAAVFKRAVVSAFKIVVKGAAPAPLSEEVSEFSLDALGDVKGKCSEDFKKFVTSVIRNASIISTAIGSHGFPCDRAALEALARKACKKK